MKRISANLLLIATLTTLGACASSPQTQFYSLSAVTGGSGSGDTGAASRMPPVRVAAVHIPPALDRREIVRTGAGDRLDVSGEHRWGAPFDEMVQNVLTQDLMERLPADKVVLPSGPAPSGTESIVVDLLQFQSDASGSVLLQGSWSLLGSGGDVPALIRGFRYQAAASPASYGGEASTMSRLLGRLADDIAKAIGARHPG